MQSDDLGLVERLRAAEAEFPKPFVDTEVIGGLYLEAAAAIERLVAERDEALNAEDEAKDCFWAVYPTYCEVKGHGINTEVARTELATRAEAAEAERDKLKEALTELVTAKAIGGVREIVAGWNGENRPDGPYERHPAQLGATLPKTDCGSVYELDEAMQRARQALGDT